jgi:Peptidase inhibitor family I36
VKAVITKLAVIGLPTLVAIGLATPGLAFASPSTVDSVRSAGSTSTIAGTGSTADGLSTGAVPATSPAQCPSGDLCFWVGANYTGAMGELSGNNGSWTKFTELQCLYGSWNDCASAIYNHGASKNARVFRNNNGGGGGRCIPRGTAWSNLTSQYFDNGANMNDAISSNDWVSSACS